jgi:hypothetical protein
LQAVKYIPISGIGKSDFREDWNWRMGFCRGLHIYARKRFTLLTARQAATTIAEEIISAAVRKPAAADGSVGTNE